MDSKLLKALARNRIRIVQKIHAIEPEETDNDGSVLKNCLKLSFSETEKQLLRQAKSRPKAQQKSDFWDRLAARLFDSFS